MAEQTRDTLKNYFKAGKLPAEEHFRDLIDSTMNMVDEGYRKTPEHGVQIGTLGGHSALVSFYVQSAPESVLWSLGYGTEPAGDKGGNAGKHLVFEGTSRDKESDPPKTTRVMTLDPCGRVGIAKTDTTPQVHALDVEGVICSRGRIGSYVPDEGARGQDSKIFPFKPGPVPADGNPHNITGWLSGCHAFEIVAGVGGPSGKGQYALLHAVALNSYNPPRKLLDWLWPPRRIRTVTAVYGSQCSQIKLRWARKAHGKGDKGAKTAQNGKSGEDESGKDEYCLLLSAGCKYAAMPKGKFPLIQYAITQLWFDSEMLGSQPPKDEGR